MDVSDLNSTLRVFKSVGSVFVAFNSNIDNIVHVDRQLEKFAGNAKPRHLEKIENPDDIFSGLLYSMKNSESMELVMGKKVERWLSKNIRPDRQRMGGQAGIISNMLSTIGVQAITYTPLLSKEQCRLFSKKVLLIDNGLKHADKVKRKDEKKINWIFEYDKGQKFLDIRAGDVSRFIAASRPDAFRLKDVSINFDFDCAILSGFQNIHERYNDGTTYRDQFLIAKKMIRKIKAKKKPVHIEFAYSGNRKIMENMVKITSHADSVGMDESELMRVLDILKEKKLSRQIHKKHDIRDIFNGLEKMADHLETKKIHIHGAGYFMAVCKKDYHIGPEEIKKSMDLAAVAAGAEASYKIKSRKDIIKGLKYPQAALGWKKQKILAGYLRKKGIIMKDGIAKDKYNIIIVPNRTIRNIRDVVGLGDIISASIFAAEIGYANRNNMLMKALRC
ncbi:MAG: hypothetical protein NT120_03465 [Candidatus Aenigmarchaeota archaeon]|nr:hypothetical protein [Candidatus Aenigmarchaeota archaeon]